MMGSDQANVGIRSDIRIPKLRTRGRANRQKMLTAVQRLIEAQGEQPVRFSDVFEQAGVSRGSAYRIYDGIEDLMQDLASSWIDNFVAYMREAVPKSRPATWPQLVDEFVSAGSEYWDQTADILRVLPRVRSNVPESYRQSVKDLTLLLAEIFDQHFEVPAIPEWLSVLALFTSLCDTIFADSVRRDGRVSKQRLLETQKICTTYLSFYLPEELPLRAVQS